MACFFGSSVGVFLASEPTAVLARLASGYAAAGFTSLFTDQTRAWERDLLHLREALSTCGQQHSAARDWQLLLEFEIPRKSARLDVVLLLGSTIVLLELKTSEVSAEARRQVEHYALLLHYFHKASTEHRIVPVLVSPLAQPSKVALLQQSELFAEFPTYWISPVAQTTFSLLPELLRSLVVPGDDQISGEIWDESPYHPVPSILEAAVALRSGLSIREIALSEASEHEIGDVRDFVQAEIASAREQKKHTICFLTGVPGSGKTLVGLGLAHGEQSRSEPVHFMSGNGPLVSVLQHLFTHESRRRGASAPQAKVEAKTLIENVHVFAKNYTDNDAGAPSNHAIVFDEAQRAWNRAQNERKFKRAYSEPEMLLRIMERHQDWAFVLALVGGGQEINDGEAGLEEWGRALMASSCQWHIVASPEVLEGGASTAGHRLLPQQERLKITTSPLLHLRTSNRSIRAEQLATWVNLVLAGHPESAAALEIASRFPVVLTRSLTRTRELLGRHKLGDSRIGLVGSSAAARLRAEGLEPDANFHANYPWEHWYLAPEADLRSSSRCEVFATEFEVQGLELDWVGVLWGGDLVWDQHAGWRPRKLRPSSAPRWAELKHSDRRRYRVNAYRVLLTRARQGMVLFVPPGDAADATRNPEEFDATAEYLLACGARADVP